MAVDIKNEFLSRLMDMLEQQLGQSTEIVLHDLTKEYHRTIVDIRNGQITGRKIGGFGSNLGLEVLKGTTENGDHYNYITKLSNGRYLRSSSLYFRDDQGKVVGALCINTDITDTLNFEKYLHEFNQFKEEREIDEVFVPEVDQLLDYLIKNAQEEAGKPVEEMSKDEKKEFIRYLDKKGAFQISKSSERAQKLLGISKFTFYNYLDAVRSEEEAKKAGR